MQRGQRGNSPCGVGVQKGQTALACKCGAKRSLGWIPFKALQLKRKGKSLRFARKARSGVRAGTARRKLNGNAAAFAQMRSGLWLCSPVEEE